MKLFESALLISLQNVDVVNIELVYPQDFQYTEELKSISSAVAPSLDLPNSPTIFTFNIGITLCHVLYFVQDSQPYEIIILSKTPFAYFFHSFLAEVYREFNICKTSARMRFQYVISYISSWENEVKTKMILSFPSGNKEWTFDEDLYTYKNFNPCAYLTYSQCTRIWRSIMNNEPILIIGPNARITSLACLAAMSLVTPLQYAEPFALWLRETDPRFVDIVNGNSQLMLVGSTCETLESTNYFRTIIKLNKIDELSQEVRSMFEEKTKGIMEVALTEMDSQIIIDAYSDCINQEFLPKRIATFIEISSDKTIEVQTVINFSNTKTFWLWRKRNMNRTKWREAFLSADANAIIKNKTVEQCKTVLTFIEAQMKRYEKDKHVMSALKYHHKLLRQKINGE